MCPPSMAMSPEDTVQACEEMGGNLTIFSPFGVDPLADPIPAGLWSVHTGGWRSS